MDKWKGCIVEESLNDNRVLNNIEIIKVIITQEEKPEKRWHIYNSLLSEEEIKKIHSHLKQSWYMHFWKDNKMMVLFKGKRFILDIKDKNTWKEAIGYGLSIGIPKEQLDFEIGF
jgi:hypothetical protein